VHFFSKSLDRDVVSQSFSGFFFFPSNKDVATHYSTVLYWCNVGSVSGGYGALPCACVKKSQKKRKTVKEENIEK
jgi:hypothetical protein